MKYPTLYTKESSRQMVDVFRGYNHNLRIRDGEFFDMQNMTSDYYPVLSPRGKRGIYASPASPTGLIAKDSLCYVDGSKFVINEYQVEMGLSDEPKQLISMGAYVIIMPDKMYINTQDLTDFGKIEAAYPGVEGMSVTASYEMCKVDGTAYEETTKSPMPPENPKNMQLWMDTSSVPHVLKQYSETQAMWQQIATTYVKIAAPNIAAQFNQYDSVAITGIPEQITQLQDLEGQVCPLWAVHRDPGDTSEENPRAEGTYDYVVIVGILDEAVTATSNLRLERPMPNMDFVIESENRLWGCRYGVAANGQVVNEIYASKLGDFRNWYSFMGLSTDSYVASCGTDGQFTGAITHLGYPLFFKENCVHKVFGNYPANFQIQTTACRGVQKGCERSLAIVNETLYYKARSGVCAYDGSLPVEMSGAFGDKTYSDAVGGAHGNKYYVSMKDAAGEASLMVYDTAKGMWHKEDDLSPSAFCSCRGELYAIAGGKIITMLGSGKADPESVEWMAQTGEIGISTPDMKYISRLTVRLLLDVGSEVRLLAQYDFSDAWEELCVLQGTSLRSYSVPIRPKRCDHMKLRIAGVGNVKIYSITKTIEQGSERS
jgi:hypothetical protein